jgi:hypothetical protein
VTRSTESLIESLAGQAVAVRRLRPPALRAALWLTAVLAVSAVGVILFSDVPATLARADRLDEKLAFLGALLTGATAVVAACHLALPDRSRLWALAPLPPLLLWLGSSGYGCLHLWGRPSDGDSGDCLVFILATGAPLAALLFWRLRRARPLDPRRVGAVGALGVAGLSAALLQFFHPFEVTWLDLSVHLLAIGVLIGASTLASRRALAPPGRT